MSEIELVSVLPSHSSGIEKAMEGAGTKSIRQTIPKVWDVDECPEELLPWLAHTLSVDSWQQNWGEARKRDVIRASVDVHKHKGTLYAVKRAIEALGYEASVAEWHNLETPGAPYTYELVFDQREVPALLEDLRRAVAAVDQAKSVRSHMTTLRVRALTLAEATTGMVVLSGTETNVNCHFYGATFSEHVVVVP